MEELFMSVIDYIESVLPLILSAVITAVASYFIYRFNLRNANRKTELADLKRIFGIIIQMETLRNERLDSKIVNHSLRTSDAMIDLIIKLNQEVATNSIYRDTDFNTFYTHLNLIESELNPLKQDILANIKQVEAKLNK